MNKITVIGTGCVGSTIAYTLAVESLASEIVMIDINEEKALGEALDIRQGLPFCSPVNIYAGSYYDARESDIVILTSGVARKPGQSRMDLTNVNIEITRSILPQIAKYAPDALYIIVANPVDVLTYVVCRETGIPENHIMGTGTILDTARLRARIAQYYSINQQGVHACVMGEHGDSSFVPWSLASISMIPIKEYKSSINAVDSGRILPDLDCEEIETYIRKSGARIIARKGATFYAVSLAVTHLCKCLLNGIDTSVTVSTMLHGEYGISDVCLSILTTVGRNGVSARLTPELTGNELAALRSSSESIRSVINKIYT